MEGHEKIDMNSISAVVFMGRSSLIHMAAVYVCDMEFSSSVVLVCFAPRAV